MGGTSIFGWMEPNHFDKEAAEFLMEKAGKAPLVGDCKKVGNLHTVIWGAWDVAMKL